MQDIFEREQLGTNMVAQYGLSYLGKTDDINT